MSEKNFWFRMGKKKEVGIDEIEKRGQDYYKGKIKTLFRARCASSMLSICFFSSTPLCL